MMLSRLEQKQEEEEEEQQQQQQTTTTTWTATTNNSGDNGPNCSISMSYNRIQTKWRNGRNKEKRWERKKCYYYYNF